MTDLRRFLFLALLHVLSGAESAPTQADEQAPTAQHLEFFEKEVRPLLVKHCYQCHSVNAKRVEAKLLLDSRASQLRGGDSGAVIVPGNAENSLLIAGVRYRRPH